MSSRKSLEKTTTKYHCMVSGEKTMTPCSGCSNPKGCLSRAMQYKENEEMDEMDEKAVVKINADGEVVTCAKGLDAGKCGYKAGAKVCGACGAMAVTSKAAMEPAEDTDEDYSEEMNDTLRKRKRSQAEMRDENLGAKRMKPMAMDDDEDDEDDAMEMDMDDDDDEDMDDMPMKRRRSGMGQAGSMEEMPKMMWDMKPKKRSRVRAMEAMGMKSEEIEEAEDSFMCQFERKMHPASANVCAQCPGGCAPEGDMPGILDIEGMALEMFGGKVLSSGYADEADLFIVDLLAKDGRPVEILADGTTGEVLNFHRLNALDVDAEFGQKSLDGTSEGVSIVSMTDAEEIAVKTLQVEAKTDGQVVQAEAEIFEGYDAYVFEIDAINGKSYDVFVGLDGTVLGYDEYEAGEAEEIEAEAAEIALKRAYSDERREEMAKRGMALPDGSYPIADEADLRNAIQAFGRAKDKDRAKAHIMKRAMDLNLEELIPENWIPKDVQKRFAEEGEKSAVDDADLIKSLMEFEMMAIEEDLKDQF